MNTDELFPTEQIHSIDPSHNEEIFDKTLFEDAITCPQCHGEGEIMTCIDDICHGVGFCIHGDGMRTCPTCAGEGEIDID